MTKARTEDLDMYWSPVANNPRDNELYINKKEWRDEKRFNKEKMLFDKAEDALSRIISKREPGEPRKTEYPKINKKQFDKDMTIWKQRNQQALARDRLKRKGAVPTKSGKKLFEDFMKDMREATGNKKKQIIDDADMRNIYNSAKNLPYEKWLWFVSDEYGSRIKKG
jgi:hypothetical protein